MVELPEATDDHRSELVAHAQDAATAKNAADCYDVVTLDVIWTAEFAKWGYIVPLDPSEFDTEAFLERPIESVRYQDKLWAIPVRPDVGLLYYRKDILDAARTRFPTSWNELRTAATTLARQNDLDGYVSQFDQYEGFTVNVLESIWAEGGDVLGRDGGVLIDSAATRAGMARILQGFRDEWIPRRTMDFNEERTRTAFQDGKALFMRNWTYAYPLLSDRNSPVAGKFDVAPLPVPSALGGWNVALSRCSKNRGTAREFMRFLTSAASQRTLFTQGAFAPSRKALYEDATLLNDYPYLRVIEESIHKARNRPVTPYYDEVSSAIQAHLHAALTGPSTLDSELDKLSRDLGAAAYGR